MPVSTVPVLTLSALDPVLRGSAAAGMLCDLPGAVVVQHDLDPPAPDGSTLLRRTVFDAAGVSERGHVDLGHGCLSCALREDILPTLSRIVDRRPALVVLALPVAAEPLPLVRALQLAAPVSGGGVIPRPAAVATAVDGTTLIEDLLGDETLAERGAHFAPDDDRAVGEVLAHQVEYSDVLLTPGPLPAPTARLVEHLATGDRQLHVRPLHAADVTTLAAMTRPASDPRGDLARVGRATGPGASDGDGIWTIEMSARRALHPERLLERIEDLGQGRLRARGRFWVPTRPGAMCAWDGAGGQLSIGTIGPWAGRPRDTYIVVTGTAEPDHDVSGRLRAAFADVLLTDAEVARGAAWWAGRPDGLEPWLGGSPSVPDTRPPVIP